MTNNKFLSVRGVYHQILAEQRRRREEKVKALYNDGSSKKARGNLVPLLEKILE